MNRTQITEVRRLVDSNVGRASACAGLQSRLRGAQEPVVGRLKTRRRLSLPHVLSPYSTNLTKVVLLLLTLLWIGGNPADGATHKWKFSPAINEP